MAQFMAFTAYGKEIKKKLIDLGMPQTWLIERVREKTGLYFDCSYLYKIQTGKLQNPSIITAINEILNLSYLPGKETT